MAVMLGSLLSLNSDLGLSFDDARTGRSTAFNPLRRATTQGVLLHPTVRAAKRD